MNITRNKRKPKTRKHNANHVFDMLSGDFDFLSPVEFLNVF